MIHLSKPACSPVPGSEIRSVGIKSNFMSAWSRITLLFLLLANLVSPYTHASLGINAQGEASRNRHTGFTHPGIWRSVVSLASKTHVGCSRLKIPFITTMAWVTAMVWSLARQLPYVIFVAKKKRKKIKTWHSGWFRKHFISGFSLLWPFVLLQRISYIYQKKTKGETITTTKQ